MNFHIYENKNSLSSGLAEWLAGDINLVLKRKERYSIVLSGGSTPKLLYHDLAQYSRDIVDWDRVDFFWGDERYVPFNDERNNARMAFDTLLTPLNIPSDHIYIMQTNLSPEAAAAEYEARLRSYFKSAENSFDCTLLGMGEDGHTLSLFPNSSLLNQQDSRWVADTINETENLERITLMPALVNRSDHIIFLIQGPEKASTLQHVVQGKHQPETYPAQLIHTDGGQLSWFLDRPAAAKIKFSG